MNPSPADAAKKCCLPSRSVPEDTSTCWELLVKSILKVDIVHFHATSVSRKQFRMRRLKPCDAVMRRWSFLHDVDSQKTAMEEQRASLISQAPPREFTLSYQQTYIQTLDRKRWEKQMRSRWNRMFFSICLIHRRRARRNAVSELASLRMGARGETMSEPPQWQSNVTPPYDHNTSAVDEEAMAAQLGLDVATYRMLRQLEERDIMPEDYELLGRLDDSVKATTLSSSDLARFEIRMYTPSSNSCLKGNSLEYGLDYWRLPLPVSPDDEHGDNSTSNNFGIDYWKLPVAALDDACEFHVSDHSDLCSWCSSDICGVCLVDFDDGDELRVLPCGHSFHKECIDHWLLNSSTVCPVCKHDLRHVDLGQ